MKKLCFIGLVFLCAACVSAKSISIPITGSWKYAFGDSSSWADPAFNDSNWKSVEVPCKLPITEGDGWLWIRRTLTVPEALKGQPVYLNMGKSPSDMEIYMEKEGRKRVEEGSYLLYAGGNCLDERLTAEIQR